MKTEELEEFHNLLKEHISGYHSMLIDGSVAVGDTWVPGESDYDILLIFEDDYTKYLTFVREYLRSSTFTDEYLFVPFLKEDYTRTFNNAHDFSRRFRTKVLFGEDITQVGELPSHKKCDEIYTAGLKSVLSALEHRLMSAEFWSEEKVKETFHIYFKRAFMYLMIREYVKSEEYPRTRKRTAELIDAPATTGALHALENRADLSKEEVIKIVEELIQFLKKI